MKIGVLAVQGAFIEHEHIIEKIGHEVVEIRQKKKTLKVLTELSFRAVKALFKDSF